MALIVEDGTGLVNAESYESVENCLTYWAARPLEDESATFAAAVLANQESALRLATEWIDLIWEQVWKGTPSVATQALDWPRARAKYPDGRAIDYDEVPVVLRRATCEMATRILVANAAGVSVIPDQDVTGGAVKAESLTAGPLSLSTTYADGALTGIKTFTKVEALLSSLVDSSMRMTR